MQFVSHDQMNRDKGVQEQGNRAGDHRARFGCRIEWSIGQHRKPKSGKRHRWCCCKQAGEALGVQNISERREQRHDETTDGETKNSVYDEVLLHDLTRRWKVENSLCLRCLAGTLRVYRKPDVLKAASRGRPEGSTQLADDAYCAR